MPEPDRRRLSVVVADIQPLWLEILTLTLARGGVEVVGEAVSSGDLLEMVLDRAPDVVVTGIALTDGPVAETVALITREAPDTRVLALSPSLARADVTAMVRAGAASYVQSTVDREGLLDAVRRTAAGESVVPAELAGVLLGEYRRVVRRPRQAGPQLTPRESQVLGLIGLGLSYADIADELYLSHRTVQNHAQHMMGKLGVRGRVELALYAIEHGYTRPEDRR